MISQFEQLTEIRINQEQIEAEAAKNLMNLGKIKKRVPQVQKSSRGCPVNDAVTEVQSLDTPSKWLLSHMIIAFYVSESGFVFVLKYVVDRLINTERCVVNVTIGVYRGS